MSSRRETVLTLSKDMIQPKTVLLLIRDNDTGIVLVASDALFALVYTLTLRQGAKLGSFCQKTK